jgi:hypothetical protein
MQAGRTAIRYTYRDSDHREGRDMSVDRILACLSIVLAALSSPAAAEPTDLLVGREELSFGYLQVNLPPGWVAKSDKEESRGTANYAYMAAGGKEFLFLITPFPALKERSTEARCAAARSLAEEGVRFFAKSAEESDIPIREGGGAGSCLYYISITDKTVKQPSMEDFKYVTSGGVATGHLLAHFTILHNVKNEPEIKLALNMLQTARHVGGPEDLTATAAAATRLRYPGRYWSLVIDASGMKLDPVNMYRNDTSLKFGGHSADDDLKMTIFIEPALLGDDPKAYRKRYRKRVFKEMPVEQEDVRESQRKGLSLLWYTNVVEGGVRQPNVNAFLVRDAVYVDIHLFSTGDEAAAERLFNEFINSVRIEE